jgi:hypothetical protein
MKYLTKEAHMPTTTSKSFAVVSILSFREINQSYFVSWNGGSSLVEEVMSAFSPEAPFF